MRGTEHVIRTLVHPENYGAVVLVVFVVRSLARSFVRSFVLSLSSSVRSFVRSFVRNLDLFRAITTIRVHLNNRSLIVIRPFPTPPVPSFWLPAAYTMAGNGEHPAWAYITDRLGNVLRTPCSIRAQIKLTQFKFITTYSAI